PAARLSSVDLPAPEGPTMATIARAGRSKLTPRRTSSERPSPVAKRFETSRKERAGAPGRTAEGADGGMASGAFRLVLSTTVRPPPRLQQLAVFYISGSPAFLEWRTSLSSRTSWSNEVDRQLPVGDEIFLDHIAHFVPDREAARAAL